MARFDGKTAFITGAGSGIGRATALLFVRDGAKGVAVIDRDRAGGMETVALIEAAGGQGLFVETDVTRPEQIEAAVRATVDRFGSLDCAYNNAGAEGAMPHRAEDADDDNLERLLALNVRGLRQCMKFEIRQMLAQGGGAIVNAGSTAGLRGVPGGGDYVATKHAVIGLTRSAALENARTNIRVNAVCASMVETPLAARLRERLPTLDDRVAASPAGRMARAEEVGEAVIWLCSDAASFVTGQALAVDGGGTAGLS